MPGCRGIITYQGVQGAARATSRVFGDADQALAEQQRVLARFFDYGVAVIEATIVCSPDTPDGTPACSSRTASVTGRPQVDGQPLGDDRRPAPLCGRPGC